MKSGVWTEASHASEVSFVLAMANLIKDSTVIRIYKGGKTGHRMTLSLGALWIYRESPEYGLGEGIKSPAYCMEKGEA